MKIIIAASFALTLVAVSAQARVPVPVMKLMGADFYMRCTNPPRANGAALVGVCAAYVAGIADGLEDAGQVCLSPQMTAKRLLPFALNWINNHMQNGSYPAALQIKTGLVNTFPCRPVARSMPKQQPSLENAISLGAKFVALWKEAQPLLAMILP